MEGGDAVAQHDYHELEMLLKEIPNATSVVSQQEQTVRSRIPLRVNEVHSMREKEDGSMPNGSPAYSCDQSPRATSIGGETNSHGVLIGREGAVVDKGKEESSLPDDQYLTLAFEEMGLNEIAVRERMAREAAKYDRILPQCVLRLGQQNPYASDLFGFESSGIPSPSTLPSAAYQNPSEMLSMGCGEVDGHSPKFMDLERRAKQSERLPFDAYDQTQRFPYSALNANSGNNGYCLSGWGAASPPYQPYQFDPTPPFYMMPYDVRHSTVCRSNEEEMWRQRLQLEPFYSMDINHRMNHGIYKKQNSACSWPSGSVEPGSYRSDQRHGLNGNDGYLSAGSSKYGHQAMSNGTCRFYAQGFCSKGSACSFSHGRKEMSANGVAYSHHSSRNGARENSLERSLGRSQGLNSPRMARSSVVDGAFDSTDSSRLPPSNSLRNHRSPVGKSVSTRRHATPNRSSDDLVSRRSLKSLSLMFKSLDEVTGHISSLAKDQDGCRRLQEKFQEGSEEDVEKVFREIDGDIVELMTDPFGNYLVQKLLEYCNDHQKTIIVDAITVDRNELVRIACDMHGTRAVQKVIETLSTPEQFARIASALSPVIVLLMKDVNGNHVAQRCLQFSLREYSAFVYNAASAYFIELATDRHGCCVLQKCLQHANDMQRRILLYNIVSNAFVLSTDAFGNYVVQCAVREFSMPAKAEILNRLQGCYGMLSVQKCGSHVVEKCMSSADENQLGCIIRELLNDPQLAEIMQDQYGNYVIQKALGECQGPLRAALVQTIGFYQSLLRSSQYGKKVLTSAGFKK